MLQRRLAYHPWILHSRPNSQNRQSSPDRLLKKFQFGEYFYLQESFADEVDRKNSAFEIGNRRRSLPAALSNWLWGNFAPLLSQMDLGWPPTNWKSDILSLLSHFCRFFWVPIKTTKVNLKSDSLSLFCRLFCRFFAFFSNFLWFSDLKIFLFGRNPSILCDWDHFCRMLLN